MNTKFLTYCIQFPMPLDLDFVADVEKRFSEVDQKSRGYITKEEILPLLDKLGIKENLSESAQSAVVEGLSCKDKIKVTKEVIVNFCTVIHDKDDLGLLKVCMRGVTVPGKPKVSIQQAMELSEMLGIPKTTAELQGNSDDKTLTFPQLAEIFYNIEIPKEATQFDGMQLGSKCCLLI